LSSEVLNVRRGRPRRNREQEVMFLVELGFNIDQIVRMTKLKRNTVRRYLWKIRRNLGENVDKNVDKNPMKCPDCGSYDFYVDRKNGEVVCKNCGLVVSFEVDFDTRLPFDTTYALESSLAVGKSLGGTLSGKGLFKVLAKAPSGTKDLGLRARHIRVMTETSEHPQLARLLKDAYGLSKRFGVENDKLFNQDLGINIRRAFWLVKELCLGLSRKAIAETVFWMTLCQYGKRETALKAENVLKSINPTLLNLTIKLNYFLLTIRKEKPPSLDVFKLAIQK